MAETLQRYRLCEDGTVERPLDSKSRELRLSIKCPRCGKIAPLKKSDKFFMCYKCGTKSFLK
jgi:DNA-directed RNA polymerase subunit RPC12/RpoP